MIQTKFFWGDVINVGKDYIDIAKDGMLGISIPEAGDHIFQLGNEDFPERQNAQILSTVGDDAPSWKMYEKINTKSLEGKMTSAFTSKGNILDGKTKFQGKDGESSFDDIIEQNVPKIRIEVDKEVIPFIATNGVVNNYSNGTANVKVKFGNKEVYPLLDPTIEEDFSGIRTDIETLTLQGCSATLVNGLLTITQITTETASIIIDINFNRHETSFNLTLIKINSGAGADGIPGYTPIKGTDYFDGAPGQNGISSFLWVRYSQSSDGTGMTTSPTNAKYVGLATTAMNTPPNTPGTYQWTLIKGTDGIPGEIGEDGKTSYLHIKYSDDGIIFTAAAGALGIGETVGAYIGTYVDFVEADSEVFSRYTWNRVRGENGYTPVKGTDYFDGTDGQDGISRYLWIRYSQNSDGSGMVSTPTNAKYIGISTTTTSTAPTNISLYQWSLIKGTDGVPGEIGSNGQTSYLHIKYSDNGTSFTGNNGENVGAWIGTYVDFIEADSTVFSAYTWNKIKGEDGTGIALKESQATEAILKSLPSGGNTIGDARIVEDTGHLWVWDGTKWTDAGEFKGQDGANGVDGQTQYLHIKYSNDGTTFTPNNGEDVGDWIGTFVDFIEGETHTIFSDYKWAKIKGINGYTPVKGTDYFDGDDGQNGISSFLWVRYSQNANGSSMTTSPTGAKYIGIATTTASTAPASYLNYDWSLIKGTDGIPGEPGVNGQTSYLHIKYSNDGVTFTPANGAIKAGETVGKYIGTYVDFIEEDSTVFSAYTWNKVGGEDGVDGSSAPLLYLSASAQVMKCNPDFTAQTGQTIIFEAKIQNVLGDPIFEATPYNAAGGVLPKITLSGIGRTRSLNNTQWGTAYRKIEIKATLGSLVDVITIYRLSDGNDGNPGSPGADGTNGIDGKNAVVGFLTNESVTLQASSTGVVSSFASATGTFQIFDGPTRISTGVVFSIAVSTGCTATINASTGIYSVSAMSTDNATVILRAVYKGATIEKVFTLSKSKDGTVGSTGASAPLLFLTASSQLMTTSYNNIPDVGQTISIEAKIQNVAGTATFVATPYNDAGTALAAITLGGTGNIRTIVTSQWLATFNKVVIKATLGALNDTMSIYRIADAQDGTAGVDSISAFLSNENVTLQASSGGVVVSLSSATGTFEFYKGTTKVTVGLTFSKVSNTGCVANINATTGVYTVDSMSANSASAIFRVEYREGGVLKATINKTLTLSKSLAGTPGSNGTDGATGPSGPGGLNVIISKQGSFKVYYERYDGLGNLIPNPVAKRAVIGGVEIPVGSGNFFVRCKAYIFKGGVDVTASAISKGADLMWYVNGMYIAITGSNPKDILLLDKSYADGEDDDVQLDFEDTNFLTW